MFAVLLALGMFNGEGGFATPFRLAVVGSGRLCGVADAKSYTNLVYQGSN
jgi:hypothetical protein